MRGNRKPQTSRRRTHSVTIDGDREVAAAIAQIPTRLESELADATARVTEAEAIRLRQAADTKQARMVAPSIKVTSRKGFPGIIAGGSATIPGKAKTKFGQVFFGAEFGGQGRRTTFQFRPHNGVEGYWFYEQLREDTDRVINTLLGAVDRVIEQTGMGAK